LISRLKRFVYDKNSQRRIFFFHETAVNAYFKFIALSGDGCEDKIISATLRLLQLTVRHALELQVSLASFSSFLDRYNKTGSKTRLSRNLQSLT
jgi:hypothetical protein